MEHNLHLDRATMAPKVLLTDTSRFSCSSRVAIGLSKCGCDVSAVCPTRGHPLLKTSVVRQTFPYSGLRPQNSLMAAIEASKPQFIIPCDDRATQHLHELYGHACDLGTSGRDLAALIEGSLGSPESYPIVSARYNLLRIARELGLRVPETSVIDSVGDLKSCHAKHPLPWVLKADGTWGGSGVKIAHTAEQAEQFFLKLTRPYTALRALKRLSVNRDPFYLRPWWNGSKPSVIVQSHIHGTPANCAVLCWEGKILAGIAVEVVSSEGLTGPANVVRVVDSPDMIIPAERIACRLGLTGFFGLDFMIQKETGFTYLIEMNPRSTLLSHFQLGNGRDLMGALCAQLTGQPFRETRPVTQNDMIAYFPEAWNCKSEFLESSFHDVPEGELNLVQELLRPWPDRSLLFRATNCLSRVYGHFSARDYANRRGLALLSCAAGRAFQQSASAKPPAHIKVLQKVQE